MRSEGSSKGEFSIEDFVSGRTIRNSFPYRVTNEYDEVRYIAMQGDCPGEYIVNPKDPHHKSLQRVSTFFLSPQEPNLSRLGSAYFQGLRCVNVNQFRGSNLRFFFIYNCYITSISTSVYRGERSRLQVTQVQV